MKKKMIRNEISPENGLSLFKFDKNKIILGAKCEKKYKKYKFDKTHEIIITKKIGKIQS